MKDLKVFFLSQLVIFVLGSQLWAVDDNTHYTTAGNIGLTITNYGTFGDGFVIQNPVDQPSCEYPIGSGVEHLFDGGLWIGGKRGGTTLVTTGAVDVPSLA
ncbi:hypothetical protein ISS37_10205, partial [candidate division KSB1 bacterium]|nr:hypothetical protein [candidate division KSB1 bacterium]